MITAWIGSTFGVCAWCAIRGRGGLFGLVISSFMGVIAAGLGWLAAQALTDVASPAALGVGAIAGGVLAATATVVAWGPRPKVTAVPAVTAQLP